MNCLQLSLTYGKITDKHMHTHIHTYYSILRLRNAGQLPLFKYMHPSHLQESHVLLVQTASNAQCSGATDTPGSSGNHFQNVSSVYICIATSSAILL